jgi:hypothetical protein
MYIYIYIYIYIYTVLQFPNDHTLTRTLSWFSSLIVASLAVILWPPAWICGWRITGALTIQFGTATVSAQTDRQEKSLFDEVSEGWWHLFQKEFKNNSYLLRKSMIKLASNKFLFNRKQ